MNYLVCVRILLSDTHSILKETSVGSSGGSGGGGDNNDDNTVRFITLTVVRSSTERTKAL